MKNRFFVILLGLMLLLPVSAEEMGNETLPLEDNNVYEEVSDSGDGISNNETLIQSEIPQVLPHKQPVSKKKIIKKFLLAMLGVGASSILIFVSLSIYNKIKNGVVRSEYITNGDSSLNTPDNITDAVKSFLEKTKWEN